MAVGGEDCRDETGAGDGGARGEGAVLTVLTIHCTHCTHCTLYSLYSLYSLYTVLTIHCTHYTPCCTHYALKVLHEASRKHGHLHFLTHWIHERAHHSKEAVLVQDKLVV
jgi:hypothetical protein